MLPTYILVRDHLEQAASILKGGDEQAQQIRHILERLIGLLCEYERREARPPGNVVSFRDFCDTPRPRRE